MPSKSLTVTWKGDVGDLEAKAALVEATIKRTGGTVSQVGQQQGSVWSALSNAFTTFNPRAAGVASQLENVQGKLTGVTGAAGEAAGGIGAVGTGALAAGAGIAIVAGGVTAFALKGAEDMVRLATETRQVQAAMGGSAQQASLLIAQGNALGVSADAIASSMGRASANVAAHADKLTADGVAIQKNAAGQADMGATLLSIGDAYKATEDPAKRAELARDAFGKGWQAMAPILLAGRDTLAQIGAEADRHHEIITDDQKDKALRLGVEMRELHSAVQGVGLELGQHLVPFLADLARGVTSAIEDVDHFINRFHWLGTAIKDFISITPIGALAAWGHAHRDAAGDADKLADAEGRAKALALQEADALDTAANQVKDLRDAIVGELQADAAVAKARTTLVDSLDNLADKQKALSDLQNKSLVDSKAVDQAQYDLQRSTQQLSDARENLSKVEQELSDIQNHSGAFAKDLEHANLALQHATLARAEADQKLLDAEVALANAATQHDAAGMVAGQDQLKQAQLGVKDAAQSLADAQDKVTSLQNEAIPGTQEYADKQRELRDAQDRVTDAQRTAADAQDKLTIANQGDTKRSQELRDAKKQLRDAEQSVTDARTNGAVAVENQLSAEQKLKDAFDKDAGAVQGVRDQLTTLGKEFPEFVSGINAQLALLGQAPPFAGGGGGQFGGHGASGSWVTGADTYGGGSNPGPVAPVTIIVQGSLIHQNDLHAVIANGVQEYRRNNGPAGF